MICQAAEERTVTMFFTCIFPLSAVQPVCLIQLSGKTAGNFLFLLSGSSSSCFENLLTLHLRSAAGMHFFKIMTSTRKTPKIKVRDCPCFIPNWHATQWTLSKLMMTHNLLVSKTAFREMQLKHWREAIITLREALASKMYEYLSTDKSVAYATVFRHCYILMRSRYQRLPSFP